MADKFSKGGKYTADKKSNKPKFAVRELWLVTRAWIPAYAGMTWLRQRLRHGKQNGENKNSVTSVRLRQ